MASVAAMALRDPKTQESLLKGVALLINSAPILAAAAVFGSVLQWNLEHIAIAKEPVHVTRGGRGVAIGGYKWRFKRITTEQATDVDIHQRDPNNIPLAPPIMSMVARLADEGSDTVEAAARVAQQQLNTFSNRGLIGNIQEFIFGD